MNAQEIFDTVAKHLALQGHRAIDNDHRCSYRTPSGDKCAFGVLIPDECYSTKFEGKSAFSILYRVTTNDFGLDIPTSWAVELRPHEQLITDLQHAHDFLTGQLHSNPLAQVSSIKERLALVAWKHKLQTYILNTYTFPEEWK